MTMRAFAFLVVVAVFLMPAGVRADGVSVGKRIDLQELVATSDVIVTATIQKTSPSWARREAYGAWHRYVAWFHFKVRVDEWIKGQRQDMPPWTSYQGDPPPGRRVMIEEDYDSRFSPHQAKPGQRVILFLADPRHVLRVFESGNRRETCAREIEDISLLADVQKAAMQTPAATKADNSP